VDDATADVKQRAFTLGEHLKELGATATRDARFAQCLQPTLETAKVQPCLPIKSADPLLDILWQVDDDRPGAPTACDLKGSADGRLEFFGIVDEKRVLGARR